MISRRGLLAAVGGGGVVGLIASRDRRSDLEVARWIRAAAVTRQDAPQLRIGTPDLVDEWPPGLSRPSIPWRLRNLDLEGDVDRLARFGQNAVLFGEFDADVLDDSDLEATGRTAGFERYDGSIAVRDGILLMADTTIGLEALIETGLGTRPSIAQESHAWPRALELVPEADATFLSEPADGHEGELVRCTGLVWNDPVYEDRVTRFFESVRTARSAEPDIRRDRSDGVTTEWSVDREGSVVVSTGELPWETE